MVMEGLWAWDTQYELNLIWKARSPGFSVNLDPAPQTSACLSIPFPSGQSYVSKWPQVSLEKDGGSHDHGSLPTAAGSFFVGT